MNIAIIGTGNMARGIGTRVVAGGHGLTVIGRDPASTAALADGLGAEGSTDLDRALSADVVVLATPYGASLELARALGGRLAGKVLVDISNPLNGSYDGLVTTPGTSGAEQIAALATGARVVKAFNTVFASTLIDGTRHGRPLDVFVAGDDADAKAIVAELVEDGGLVAIDLGGLARSRELEGLALLGIVAQGVLGTGFDTAWGLLRPAA